MTLIRGGRYPEGTVPTRTTVPTKTITVRLGAITLEEAVSSWVTELFGYRLVSVVPSNNTPGTYFLIFVRRDWA